MNNPLRQYFRRPALYIKLPSQGKFYPPGALEMPDNSELPVFPMTAIDEITSKTPDALFNGSAIVDIIKSCIPAIKDPWSVPSIDLDTILVAIRVATNGNDLEVTSTCPECEDTSNYTMNLMGLLAGINPSEYTKDMELGELTIKFRPLSYNEVNKSNLAQFDIQREIEMLSSIEDDAQRSKKSAFLMKQLSEMNIDIIATTIESITLPTDVVTNQEYIREYLHGCDRNTHETIRQHVVKIRDSVSVKPMKIRCVSCKHEYTQPLALNVTDFFG